MRRRDFIEGLGSAAAWPVVAPDLSDAAHHDNRSRRHTWPFVDCWGPGSVVLAKVDDCEREPRVLVLWSCMRRQKENPMPQRLKIVCMAVSLLISVAHLSDVKAQTLTATQRAAQFGLSQIRGIAYIPGPQLTGCLSIDVVSGKNHCFGSGSEAKIPLDPNIVTTSVLPYYQNGLQTYTSTGAPSQYLGVQYTIYYDSDFYNADFQPLWGTPGRNDLQDM
jgi:hypothetical protein